MEDREDQEFITKMMANVRRLRKEKKMTQLDVAVACGMEENAFQKLESARGANPTVKTLLKISRAMDIEVIELLAFPKDNSGDNR